MYPLVLCNLLFLTVISEYSDPYFVLDISRNASKADIKKAYKKMARKYHPDVNKAPDAAEKFQIVHDAYNVSKILIFLINL